MKKTAIHTYKNKFILRFLLCILLFSFKLSAYSQLVYPIQTYTQLTSPYTSHLPSYYSGFNEKLSVTLINTDMQQPSVDVYLKMKIQSSAFTLETPDNVMTQILSLQAGIPLKLSLNDLAVYFKDENIRISGSRSEFLKTNQLPDNFYRFQFQVYEMATGRLLSNPKLGFAQAMITSGEPPFLNLPKKGSTIPQSNIPNIMFTWTPRHLNSVATAYSSEYEYTLVEIYDKNIPPEATFLYSPVLYQTTTRATSLIYSSAQPMLMPGSRYAWRVQVKAKEGIEDANVFKNNGYSEVFWFDYQEDCNPVSYDKVEVRDRVAVISWRMSNAIDYQLEYRRKGADKWYVGALTNQETCPIYNLQMGKEYEYRIGVRCNINDSFTFGDIKGFRMPDAPIVNKNCGMLPNINIAGQTPIQTLDTNAPIWVGDFPVFVTKTEGIRSFTGTGYVAVPFLGNLKYAVKFKDIQVNLNNQLINGFIEVIYDPTNNGIVDLDKVLSGGSGVGDLRDGNFKISFVVDYVIKKDISKIAVESKDDEDEIKDQDGGEVISGTNEIFVFTFIDEEGKEHKKEVQGSDLPLHVKDASGAVYKVDKEGNVTPAATESDLEISENELNKNTNLSLFDISLEKTGNTKYAIDNFNPTYKKVTEYEREYKVEDTSPLRANAKFVLANTPEEVNVVFSIKEDNKQVAFDISKVKFMTSQMYELTPKSTKPRSAVLTLEADEVNTASVIYILYPKPKDEKSKSDKEEWITIGAIRKQTYEPVEVNVIVVPVGKGQCRWTQTQIEQYLNEVYNKFGVSINVSVSDTRLDYTPKNGTTFGVEDAKLFDNKSADMNVLEGQFMKRTHYNDNTVYLFDMGIKANKDGVEGDMPRDSRFGYLFGGATLRTIAHEIGHGVFNLRHPFAKGFFATQFTENDLPDNLMDYGIGTNLAKLQWDAIRNPGTVFGILEKRGDSQVKKKAGEYLGFAPNGRIITKNDKELIIVVNDQWVTKIQVGTTNYIWDETKEGYFDANNNIYEVWEKEEKAISGKVIVYHVAECIFYQVIEVKDYTHDNFNTIPSIINSEKWILDTCPEVSYNAKSKYFDLSGFKIPKALQEYKADSLSFTPQLLKLFVDDFKELRNRNVSNYTYNGEKIGDFKHIYVDKNEDLGIDIENLKILDAHLTYLSELSQQKGFLINYYVIFQETGNFIGENWDKFAEEVLTQSGIDASSTMLVTIPYAKFTKDSYYYDQKYVYTMPGVYIGAKIKVDKDRLLKGTLKSVAPTASTKQLPSYLTITKSSVWDFVTSLYRNTYKPLMVYTAFHNPDNTVDLDSINREEHANWVSGADACRLLVSKQHKGVTQLNKLRSDYDRECDNDGFYNRDRDREYNTDRYVLTNSLMQSLDYSKSEQWIELDNEIIFKEYKVDHYWRDYFKYYAFRSSLQRFSSDLGWYEFDYKYEDTWNKSLGKTLDTPIYYAIDGSSIILSPIGLDFIPDGIGAIYSGIRGNYGDAAIYSASFLLVGVPGGGLKVIKHGVTDGYLFITKGKKIYQVLPSTELKEVSEQVANSLLIEKAWKKDIKSTVLIDGNQLKIDNITLANISISDDGATVALSNMKTLPTGNLEKVETIGKIENVVIDGKIVESANVVKVNNTHYIKTVDAAGGISNYKKLNRDEIRNLISTEEGAQFQMENMKKILQSDDREAIAKLWEAEPIEIFHYNGETYIINGHNRLRTLYELNLDTPKEAIIIELTEYEMMLDVIKKDKLEFIKKHEFNTKISD